MFFPPIRTPGEHAGEGQEHHRPGPHHRGLGQGRGGQAQRRPAEGGLHLLLRGGAVQAGGRARLPGENSFKKLISKQEQTLFNDLQKGIAILNPTGRLKKGFDYPIPSPAIILEWGVTIAFQKTRWSITHYDFRWGVTSFFPKTVVQRIQGGSSHSII